jgi:dUTP pyrophosphatase
MQKIKVKYFDKTLPKIGFQTKKAAGFDLYSRVTIKIKPKEIVYVSLNVAFQLPSNSWLMLISRSSLHKKGLIMINGIGVGDTDYCGNEDEYQAILFNFSSKVAEIKKGERLVQGILRKKHEVEFEEVRILENDNRGGIGSTGK